MQNYHQELPRLLSLADRLCKAYLQMTFEKQTSSLLKTKLGVLSSQSLDSPNQLSVQIQEVLYGFWIQLTPEQYGHFLQAMFMTNSSIMCAWATLFNTVVRPTHNIEQVKHSRLRQETYSFLNAQSPQFHTGLFSVYVFESASKLTELTLIIAGNNVTLSLRQSSQQILSQWQLTLVSYLSELEIIYNREIQCGSIFGVPFVQKLYPIFVAMYAHHGVHIGRESILEHIGGINIATYVLSEFTLFYGPNNANMSFRQFLPQTH